MNMTVKVNENESLSKECHNLRGVWRVGTKQAEPHILGSIQKGQRKSKAYRRNWHTLPACAELLQDQGPVVGAMNTMIPAHFYSNQSIRRKILQFFWSAGAGNNRISCHAAFAQGVTANLRQEASRKLQKAGD